MKLLQILQDATNANLTVVEAVFLLILAVLAHKKRGCTPVLYCILLILYITLLRRAPGYNEDVQLRIKLWPNAGVWVGDLLNLILYAPYGGVSWQWKREGKKIVAIGFVLSMLCEAMQYLTGRGMADVNDVLFNTLGAVTGVCIAKRIAEE